MLFLLVTAKTASPSEASPSEPYDSSFRQLIYIAYFNTIEYLYDLNIGHFWKKNSLNHAFILKQVICRRERQLYQLDMNMREQQI